VQRMRASGSAAVLRVPCLTIKQLSLRQTLTEWFKGVQVPAPDQAARDPQSSIILCARCCRCSPLVCTLLRSIWPAAWLEGHEQLQVVACQCGGHEQGHRGTQRIL
jgi:hypothetical protein